MMDDRIKSLVEEILKKAADARLGDYTGVQGTLWGLEQLEANGWHLVPPRDLPGVCPRCQHLVEEGTAHVPFNGNQMFACSVVRRGEADTGMHPIGEPEPIIKPENTLIDPNIVDAALDEAIALNPQAWKRDS